MLRNIGKVMRVQTGLASGHGDAWLRVSAREIRGKVEVEEFVANGAAIWGGGSRADWENLVRPGPVKSKLFVGGGAEGSVEP